MAQSISQEAIGATGLPGATAASRHAGATTSGAPTAGTFAVGDYVVDQSGAMWICSASGSPGTWVLTKASNITGTAAIANGGTGATSSSTALANLGTPPISYDQLVQSLLPTAWYKLSDAVGSTSAFDSSNNNASAIIQGTTTFGQTGPFTAVPLDTGSTNSSGSWIQSAASTPMTNTSVSIWFNMPSSINAVLWQARSGSGGYGLSISNSSASGAGNLLYLSAPFVVNQNTGVTVSTGWHNVVLVLDASGNQKIYLDGALVYSSTFSLIAVNNNYITIGASGGASTFTSPIAQFIVFQQALNANQISGLYNASVNPNAQLGVVINENIAGKNFVINGGMDIWQRGTSFTNPGGYTADRWFGSRDSGQNNYSYSQQTSGGITGLPNYVRIQRTSGDTQTGSIYFNQSIETTNSYPMANQTVTLSFWAKAGANYSATSNAFYARVLYGATNNVQMYHYTSGVSSFTTSFTLTTSWQKFTYTVTIPSTATQVGVEFQAFPTGTAGANDYVDFAGCQLEIAPQATPFSRAGGSIGGELALCQRYYIRYSAGSTYGILSNQYGFATTTTLAVFYYAPPVTLRTTPVGSSGGNIRIINPSAGTVINLTSTSNDGNTSASIPIIDANVASGLTANAVYFLQANNDATAYVQFSAEL